MNKTPHLYYAFLLLISIAVTACSFFVCSDVWNTIIVSIGSGGIASVCVAWLIDIRNTRVQNIANRQKYDTIMAQFVIIFRRLMGNAANECYGFSQKNEEHSFQEWLTLLSSIKPTGNNPQQSLATRCYRISGSITALQNQIDYFRNQSATLVFEGFPNISDTLQFFDVMWAHCWGTLKTLETSNYNAFCETTFILYKEFIDFFPQYKDQFPDCYSVSSISQK